MRRNRSALHQRSRERIWWIVGVCGVAEELHLLLAPPPSSFSLPEEDELCRIFMYFLIDSWYSSRKHRNCKCLPSPSKFSMHSSWVVSVGGERGTKVCCKLEMLSPLKWLLQIQGLLEVCWGLQSKHPSAASTRQQKKMQKVWVTLSVCYQWEWFIHWYHWGQKSFQYSALDSLTIQLNSVHCLEGNQC